MKVWKYELTFERDDDDTSDMALTTVEAPYPARVLHVGSQGAAFFAWLLVNPEVGRPERRRIGLVGTGHRVRPGWSHLVSWQDSGFVWHAFLPPEVQS